MWVIYVEMGVAFALLILIVWWTLPGNRTRHSDGANEAAKDQARKEESPK
jgi:hypothetical protein